MLWPFSFSNSIILMSMLSVKKFYDLVLPKMILQKAIVSFRLADLMLDNSVNPLVPDRFTPSRPLAQKIADQR